MLDNTMSFNQKKSNFTNAVNSWGLDISLAAIVPNFAELAWFETGVLSLSFSADLNGVDGTFRGCGGILGREAGVYSWEPWILPNRVNRSESTWQKSSETRNGPQPRMTFINIIELLSYYSTRCPWYFDVTCKFWEVNSTLVYRYPDFQQKEEQ